MVRVSGTDCIALLTHVHTRLHYIPLSPTYQEMYNIHAFFSGATEAALKAANSTTLQLPRSQRRPIDGDRRLRRIARAGKQWKRTLGRRVDMEGMASCDICS